MYKFYGFFQVILFFTGSFLQAQDPLFSQYYASPLHTNPAFAGLNQGPSFSINYRNQWPLLENSYNAYVTYSVGFDQYFSKIKSGIGFQLLADDAGNGLIKNIKGAFIYGYQLKLNDNSFIKGGFELGVVNLNYDWNKFVFGDQIDPISGLSPGGTALPTSEVRPDKTNVTYLDLGTGLLFFTKKYYFGFSAKHINTPKTGILGVNDQAFEGLPIRWLVHGGMEISLNSSPGKVKNSIFPAVMYARQSDFSQLNVGLQYNFSTVFAGLWYRQARKNPDAFIASFGFKKGNLKMAYSMDITISKLTLGLGGSHELSLLMNLPSKSSKKPLINDCFGAFR